MITTVKKDRESTESLIRRFTRKVQQSGLLRTARGKRFSTKELTKKQLRKKALYAAKMRKEVERLKKMGVYNYQTVRELRKRLKKEGKL